MKTEFVSLQNYGCKITQNLGRWGGIFLLPKMTNAFITNVGENTLSKKLEEWIPHTTALDVLVGYFYFSGFHHLSEVCKNPEKIRILVGMGADEKIISATKFGEQLSFSDFTDCETKEKIVELAREGFAHAKQTEQEFDGLWNFLDLVRQKKLEVRGYTKQKMHAKMYLFKTPHQMQKGAVITGSSNLSQNGLSGNLELNAVLTDPRDFAEGEKIFEELWNDSVDISEMLAEDIEKNSWLFPATPAEIFYRAAYEFVGGSAVISIAEDESLKQKNFKLLKYQDDAANQAIGILKAYNGVFLGDVVGLGKTVMGALLLRKLKERNMRNGVLVLCPPGLLPEWEHWTSELSNGGIYLRPTSKIAEILEENILEKGNIDTVLIDESHNFRNQSTNRYPDLHKICQNKKIILLSATPQTKDILDLEAQLKLFWDDENFTEILSGKSLIKFFADIKKHGNTKENAEKMEHLMREIMVRRTRSEIQENYAEDLKAQNIAFPKANDPEMIEYNLADGKPNLHHDIEQKIRKLKFARFQPKSYIKDEYLHDKTLQDLKRAGDQLSSLYRILIFKRLESSVEAARKTISRLIAVSKEFIVLAKEKNVMPFGVENILFSDDEEKIENELNENYGLEKFEAEKCFADMEKDIAILEEIFAFLKPITKEHDGKFLQLKKLVEKFPHEKLLIFSESKETAEYLKNNLEHLLKEEIGFGFGGLSKGISGDYEHIKKRFSPNSNGGLPVGFSELRILVATDSFSEGVNLQDCNRVINYDLPWNPVRVIQRVGRVNRVGTVHSQIFSYNFFPDPLIDEHLRNDKAGGTLRERVQKRIDDFQKIIGDDTKHLSPNENPEPKKYFDIATKSSDELEGGNGSFSYSALLKMLRTLRKENPELYEKIQTLPKKSWTSRQKKSEISEKIVVMAQKKQHQVFFEVELGKTAVSKIIHPENAFAELFAEISEKSVQKKPPHGFDIALYKCERHFEGEFEVGRNTEHKKITPASHAGKILATIKKVYSPTLPTEISKGLDEYQKAIFNEKITNAKDLKNASGEMEYAKTSVEVLEVLKKYFPKEQWHKDSIQKRQKFLPEILLSSVMVS